MNVGVDPKDVPLPCSRPTSLFPTTEPARSPQDIPLAPSPSVTNDSPLPQEYDRPADQNVDVKQGEMQGPIAKVTYIHPLLISCLNLIYLGWP